MTPWLDDGDVRLFHGDCLDVLRQLPDRSVHMCATSPPFYGLRDYGTGSWEDGDPDCDHKHETQHQKQGATSQRKGRSNADEQRSENFRDVCGKCGARRVDRQIGLEETPDMWVERLVAVFREVRRVLRDDGTLWVEIGDSYAAGGLGPGQEGAKQGTNAGSLLPTAKKAPPGYKPKDLLGQPWLLAFALRADGWYLRSEIIWARPNPMPESVRDRPTKAHSTVFLLSKQPRYFYDADAIREDYKQSTIEREKYGYNHAYASQFRGHPTDKRHVDGKQLAPATLGDLPPETPRGPDGRRATTVVGGENSEQHRNGERWPNPSGANARSVWTVPTEPTPFAHFATWPQALVRRMVLAGTSEKGCCPECGAPWVRQTERTPMVIDRSERTHPMGHTRSSGTVLEHPTSKTVGWSTSCDHGLDPVPCTVLDPFAGSATTMLVARNHGRHAVGIELNEQYLEIAAKRLQQLSLLTGTEA